MRYLLLTGVLVAMLSTCEMPQEPEADKPVGEGKVRVSIQVDQGYPEAERSVFPQVTLNDIDHYALWGAAVGSEAAELLPSFTTQGNPSVVLTEGVWDFAVKGYKAGGALILQEELRNQTISLTSHALTFSVAPLREGTGLISVTITLPADSGITTVLVFKDGVEQSPVLTVAENQVTYSAAEVAAGDYYYSFRLNNSAGNTLGVVSEIVQVRGRLSSEKTIALTQANLKALPDTPAVPVIEAGDGQLTVSWTGVAMAGDYEVYYSNNTTQPATPAQTVNNMTTTIISGLTNGMTYYVWIKAKNSAGTSGFSPMASGTLRLVVPVMITLKLTPPDEWDLVLETATVIPETSVPFTVEGSYAAWQWYLDGTLVGTDASYTFDGTGRTPGETFELTVMVTNNVGERRSGRCRILIAASSAITVTVKVTPMEDLNFPVTTATVIQGASRAFTVPGAYTAWQWYLDGTLVGSGARYTFDGTGRTAGETFELTVVVTNNAGERRSGRVRIRVTSSGVAILNRAAGKEEYQFLIVLELVETKNEKRSFS